MNPQRISPRAAPQEQADSRAHLQDTRRWEIHADARVTLSDTLPGRLRAGIVLGVRVCRDAALRDAVTQRMLARLRDRM